MYFWILRTSDAAIGVGLFFMIKYVYEYFKEPSSESRVRQMRATNDSLEDTTDEANEGSFICPISQQIMKDPVITPHGITYERSSIESWIDKKSTCPITRKPLKKIDLIPNYSLKNAIQNYNNRN